VTWDGGEMLPPVPEGIELPRRRWPGMEFVDRTEADDPIACEVRVRTVPRALLRAAEKPIPPGTEFELVLREAADEPVVTAEGRTVPEAGVAARATAAAQLGLDPEEWAIVAIEARPVGARRFAFDPSKIS